MAEHRTPMSRARGLGAAHAGTEHFWQSRITSVALVPLTIFLIGLLVALAGKDYATVAATLGRPAVAIPMILFVLITAHHMKIGMQVVIEDYVHDRGLKLALLLLNMFFSYAIGAVAAFALIKLSLGV
jgi:succinate dehydrogenase / fumarate reductase membrane anchor subunit